MFGTPRKDAGESEAKSPPPSKANGTETEGFPSPQAMMKEDMLKAMTPQEVGSQNIGILQKQNELYFRSFLSYARVPFSYLSPRWRRQRVVVAACATLEGRLDFSKSPRSNPPLLEGWLDLLKSPRSNPPLLEGPLEISKRPRSMGGGWYKVTLV